MSEHDEVVIQCHCGQLKEVVALQYDLPYGRVMCHCNTCRYLTGTLTFMAVPLLNGPDAIFRERLVKYVTSEYCERYFCGICGSHVAYYMKAKEAWAVCTGVIDEVKRGKQGEVSRVTGHKYMEDTIDGGFAWCFPSDKYYLRNKDEAAFEGLEQCLAQIQSPSPETPKENKLIAQCHCGQVCLEISRPNNG